MQLDRRQVEFEQAHVLHDQRVGAGVVNLPYQMCCRVEFIVVQDRIERDQNAGVETVGVASQALDVGHAIAGSGARAK